jgi:hypothetical protein
METSIQVSGRTIRLMAMVSTLTIMELDMRGIGRMTIKRGMVLKSGLMVANMMATINKVGKMEKGPILGLMGAITKVIG